MHPLQLQQQQNSTSSCSELLHDTQIIISSSSKLFCSHALPQQPTCSFGTFSVWCQPTQPARSLSGWLAKAAHQQLLLLLRTAAASLSSVSCWIMIHSLNLDSFYLTEEQLENSPSRQDGIDKDTEANLRMYGCQVIQEAGIMLGFDQVVMATGQVLLHRLYCKRSMKTFNVKVWLLLLCCRLPCLATAAAAAATAWFGCSEEYPSDKLCDSACCRKWQPPRCGLPPSWRRSRRCVSILAS